MELLRELLKENTFVINDIYNIDEFFLKYSRWCFEVYDFEIIRFYNHVYRIGEDDWEFLEISENEYFDNQLDSSYVTGINYLEILNNKNFDHFFSEFQHMICEKVMPSEEDILVEFVCTYINNSITDGKAKASLKILLAILDGCLDDLKNLRNSKYQELNKVQAFIIKEIIESYHSAFNRLLKFYSDIYPEIIARFPKVNLTENVQAHTATTKYSHSQIFHLNAFAIWEKLYSDFKIVETSRADVKFCFEAMKYDKLIHSTVTQRAFLDWINDIYQIDIGKPQYANWKEDIKRIAIYNNAKTLYNK